MRFVAFDLETTGIVPGVDRIVEIGAVRFVNGSPDAIFATLVDPQIPIPPAASNVNKITDSMVQGKPLIASLLPAFAEFCQDDVMVAHNASFDSQFLAADIVKHEGPAPKGLVMDTFALAKRVYPGLLNYKLGTLVQHLNIQATDFHRAEADAYSCGYLYWNILERLGFTKQEVDYTALLQMCKKTEYRFPQITPKPKQLQFLDF